MQKLIPLRYKDSKIPLIVGLEKANQRSERTNQGADKTTRWVLSEIWLNPFKGCRLKKASKAIGFQDWFSQCLICRPLSRLGLSHNGLRPQRRYISCQVRIIRNNTYRPSNSM